MKGKHYSPTMTPSDNINEIGEYGESTFKYPIRSKIIKKFKVNTREFSPVRYIWKSSIPDNWFKIADPSRFYNVALDKLKDRNTLKFLEETQKYIYKIRRPIYFQKPIKSAKNLVIDKSMKTLKKNLSEYRLLQTAPSSQKDFRLFTTQEKLQRYTSEASLRDNKINLLK